jgi:DNA topoisomerase-1
VPRLRRSDPSTPGITRWRRGRGWAYAGPNGDRITDPTVLDRIDRLVVPPAWTDVWISPWPNGHIQAIGTDAAGRRQYRYHDEWRTRRDAAKFDRVLEFAGQLPAIRARVSADLARPGLGRERVLACAVRLLDIGFFRVGGEEYAEQNDSYGLATIRREHAAVDGALVTFDYVAKSGKHRTTALADPEVLAVVTALLERDDPHPELLAWPADGSWVDVRSHDINAYLAEISPDVAVTAKDFRTWSATVLGAVALAVSERVATSPTARKKAISRMYQEVSHYLGNTPAVCRSSYVHPRIVDLYQGGVTILEELPAIGEGVGLGQLSTQGPIEASVLVMLRDPRARRSAGARQARQRLAGELTPRRRAS